MDSATSGEPNLLLTCECEEFDIIIEELSAGEILNTITELHQETSRVQQNVTILQEQLKSFSKEKQDGEKSSEKYNALYTEFKDNQSLLAKLINKSMKCFAQHKQRKLAANNGSGTALTSKVKTEVQTNTIPKTNQSSNSGTINHSNDKTEKESITVKSVKPIVENKEPAKGIVAPSNGISHNESGKKSSPIATKSTKTSHEVSGKPGGRKLIQEYSSKTQMDDIRAEIYKNVDKAAKENVSKLLVNNVAHIHNKDAILRSKNDILAFKAEVESQAAMENNLKEEVKPEVVKPEVVKVEEVKPEVVKVEEVKPEVVKVEEVKPEVVKVDEVKPEVVKVEEVKPEVVKVEEVKPEVVIEEVIEEVKPEVVIEEVKPEVVKVDEVKPEVVQNNGTLSPTVSDFNFGYEKNKTSTGISVTEVTISSSSTDRSPEPRPRDAVYSRQQSTDRVEQGERMSSKNMLESANVLEKLLLGKIGGTAPEGPPVKNFVIKRKENNGLGNKGEIPVTKIETISESSATHDENNAVEKDSHIEENQKSNSMTDKKGDDEGKRLISIFFSFDYYIY